MSLFIDHIEEYIEEVGQMSKADLKNDAERLVKEFIDEGEEDAIEEFTKLSKAIHFLNEAASILKNTIVYDELQNYDNDTTLKNGVEVSISTGATTYSFDLNPLHAQLKQQVKELETRMKQSLKSNDIIVDPETGEEIPPAKIKTAGKAIVKVSIK